MRINRDKPKKMKLTTKDLSLEADVLLLLHTIESGVRVFTPQTATRQSLLDFQQIVKTIRMLESHRYIEGIDGLNLLTSAGQSCIDKVRLRGGLIEKGRAVLAYNQQEALKVQSAPYCQRIEAISRN